MKPLAISAGDPAGIGYELIIKAWLLRKEQTLPSFIIIGDISILANYASQLGLEIELHNLQPNELADKAKLLELSKNYLSVVQLNHTSLFSPGIPKIANAQAVIEAIEIAATLVHQNICSALVTCPIAKKILYSAGFAFPGHTEFLASIAQKLTKSPAAFTPVMMLKGKSLTTVPVTIHTSLASVPKLLTKQKILEISRITHNALKNHFNIVAPRLAYTGLNPHAGEAGTMGSEEKTIIIPAIAKLQSENILASGPFPADSLFHEAARQTYDVAICMYHDQALIPIKTLEFDQAVNITLGLPFTRTSPDHGTAFNIAGQGKAAPTSLINAIKIASQLSNFSRSI